jgi:hypothetical protein
MEGGRGRLTEAIPSAGSVAGSEVKVVDVTVWRVWTGGHMNI